MLPANRSLPDYVLENGLRRGRQPDPELGHFGASPELGHFGVGSLPRWVLMEYKSR